MAAFESEKVILDVEGPRYYPILTICERQITKYEQLDRFIEVLNSYRNYMRDGKPSTKEGLTIIYTI